MIVQITRATSGAYDSTAYTGITRSSTVETICRRSICSIRATSIAMANICLHEISSDARTAVSDFPYTIQTGICTVCANVAYR